MKTAIGFSFGSRRISSRRIITPFAILLIASANACYADTNQVSIGISDILHHVELSTVPLRNYTATVHQIVTRTNTLASTAMLANQPSSTEEEYYFVNCTTSGVIRVSNGLSLKQLPQITATASIPSTSSGAGGSGSGGGGVEKQPQQSVKQNTTTSPQLPQDTATASTPSASSGGGGGGTVSGGEKKPQQNITSTTLATVPTNEVRMLITINPINTLRHIEQMHSGTIRDDVYQNTACYKISGGYDRFSFDLLVSKSDWCVCRETISRDATVLLDTQFEYKHWNGSLVPVQVVITKPSNGTRVEQQFSAHTYASTN